MWGDYAELLYGANIVASRAGTAVNVVKLADSSRTIECLSQGLDTDHGACAADL